MVKYVCKDCGNEFDQKSHYDRHLNKKIPCILKDKPLKEVINEAVKKQVSQTIKETDKQIIIKKKSVSDTDSSSESDNEDNKSNKSKITSKDNKSKSKSKSKKEEKEIEIDYSYLRLPTNEVIFELKENDNKDKKIKNILKTIDSTHNILFQAENIVGHKALQIIMSILFIKLIEPYLSNKKQYGKIDLLDKKYYGDKFDDEETLNTIFGYFKDLKTLIKLPLKEIRNDDKMDAIKQMGEILKRHPITKMIYTEANFLKIREASTVQAVINEIITKINFKDFEENEDAIGEIYEHMLTKYVKSDSKELGQFFTPRKLMKLILEFKKSRIIEILKKKENNTIGDTCMGTAGWLVSGYNMFKKYNINIVGGEVEPETFQYGLMNIILTQHKFPDDIQCNSSLTHVNSNKITLITTNPPFNSKKQIKFDKIKQNFENDVYTTTNNIKINDIYKLQKDDPPIQFLELDIYKLEDDGMCLIVLPYGEFFSGKSFKNTRKYFIENINITDIILVPKIFTHTDIKTCLLIFEKNKSGTKEIKFSKINDECTTITHMTTIKVVDIQKEPDMSWYHTDYLTDKMIYDLSLKMPNFEWIEFGKIFTLEKGKTQSSEVDDNEIGKYPFITKAKNDKWKKINNYTIDGENLFIAKAANNIGRTEFFPVRYYNGKADFSNLLLKFNINKIYEKNINLKFYYYYFNNIMKWLEQNYEKGSCNQTLDEKNLNRMKIPIPHIDIQKKIITKLDSSNDKIKYLNLIIDNFKQDIDNYFEWTIEIENRQPETKWVEFGKIFTLEKGEIQSSKVEEDEEGEAVLINLSKSLDFKKIKKYILDGENIFISNTAPIGLIQYYNGKCNYSNLLCHCNINKYYIDKLNIKYIYYFLLSIKSHIESYYEKGSCNKSLDIKNFNRMKIQIPAIEKQKKCISKINEMEEIINRWKQDVDNIITNGYNKFMEYLEKESIVYNNDDQNKKNIRTNNIKEDEKPKKKLKKKQKQKSESESENSDSE